MEPVLKGIRVIDLSSDISGSMAAMVLADYGADVVKVEPPGGARLRERAGFQMWNRGKRSVVADPRSADDIARVAELIAVADVLIDDFRPGECPPALDIAALRRRNPGLVHCALHGFGDAALDAVLPGREDIVAAKSGRFQGLDEISGATADYKDERPVFLASPIGRYSAAMLAVQGIAGALMRREQDGVGQQLSTSVLAGLAAATMRLAYKREGDRVVPFVGGAMTTMIREGIILTFMTAECSDGRYVQMCARTDTHFRNWLKATGLEELASDPRFAGAPLQFDRFEDLVELRERLRAAMRTKTQAEWMRLFIEEFDVGADPMLTFEEFLRHPQIVANGYLAEVDDPTLGTVRQLGRIANLAGVDQAPLRPAPAIGAHDDLRWPPRTADRDLVAASPRLPFEGITIIELAIFLAAPLSATLLAEAGARVIKVEPLEGDMYRRVGLEFVHMSHGKESIALDLKTSEGQAILHRMVADADVVLHNMRPGAPERLGAGYETLRAINPRLVYVYAASYGSKGPQSHRPAFHSTPHALCGGGVLQAGRGNAPVDDSYPDPVAGIAASAAIALGLLARARHGEGQYIETSMLAASGYVHSDDLVEYEGRVPRSEVDPQQRGLGALDRLYRCASGWVFLAAPHDDEWGSLTESIGRPDLATDSRFTSAAARAEHDDELAAELDGVFASAPASVWAERLVRAGVACVEADRQRFEEFLLEQDMVEPEQHPHFGEYFRIRPRLEFEGVRSRRGRGCSMGEHTLALLEEFGYSAAERDELVRKRVVVAPVG